MVKKWPTWYVVLVGDADGAESVVGHRFNEMRYHSTLITLAQLPRLTFVRDNPGTPVGHVTNNQLRCYNNLFTVAVAVLRGGRGGEHVPL